MRIIILGGDGYLGWPTAMHFAARNHDVAVVDNYLRRRLARETGSQPLLETPDLVARCALTAALTDRKIECRIFDCSERDPLAAMIRDFAPDTIVHYAEQPSAPYSMMGYDQGSLTVRNNLLTTLNLAETVKQYAPACHIIKLGTMGEYGTPNIEIEEGWIDIAHKGRSDRFLFPRQGGSLYHTSKIFDTDLLWFYVRTYGLAVTDLMQGPVYGVSSDEADRDIRLFPHFHYDDIFGTVINRFMAQAVAGVPLTVYGQGGQVRGYLDLRDTLQCVELAALTPAAKGELRVFNQFTEIFSVSDLADRVRQVGNSLGLKVSVKALANPRLEAEGHYYRPAHTGLLDLGLKPHNLTDDRLARMLEFLIQHRDAIDPGKILPRVSWSSCSVGQ
jgi:UDP-sulfoquinovose synthase